MLRCEDNPTCTTQERGLNQLFDLCRGAAHIRGHFLRGPQGQGREAVPASVQAVRFGSNYVFEVRESETQCAEFARVISAAVEEHKLGPPGIQVVECTFGNLLRVGTGVGCGEAAGALSTLIDLFLDGSVRGLECLDTTPTTTATTSATSTATTSATSMTATSTPTTSPTSTQFGSNLACTTLGAARTGAARFVYVNGVDSVCQAQADAINEMLASCALREAGPAGAPAPYVKVVCKEYQNEANGLVERVIGLPDGVDAAGTAHILSVIVEEYTASLAGMQVRHREKERECFSGGCFFSS